MTRSDLIDRIATQFPQLQFKDAEEGLKAILDARSNALAKGGRTEIRGFGSFKLKHKPQRIGRNPESGEKVMVPAKYIQHFKAGRGLRARVDK